MNQAKLEWYLLTFLLLVIAVVFWQVFGYMTEQGMASGGPLENAAAYPKTLAVLLGIFVASRAVTKIAQPDSSEVDSAPKENGPTITRSVLLLLFFGLYLWGLNSLGYHLATPLFLVAMLLMVGERKALPIISFAILGSLLIAFIFEVLLKIVLPGGVFRLSIPW